MSTDLGLRVADSPGGLADVGEALGNAGVNIEGLCGIGLGDRGVIHVLGKRGDLWVVELPEPALGFFERYGQMPLPPYIRREPDEADATRYQSVFARRHGAVAAPTASLHFDAALIAVIRPCRRNTRRTITASVAPISIASRTDRTASRTSSAWS